MNTLVSRDKSYSLLVSNQFHWFQERLEKMRIDQIMATLASKLPDSKQIYLVGGSVRDLFADKTPNDLDVIIRSRHKIDLFEACKDFGNAKKNAFGSLELYFSCFGLPLMRIDLWYFDEMYHLKSFSRANEVCSEADFLQGFDFTINAAMYDIDTKALYYHPTFFEDFANGIVRFNQRAEIVADIGQLIIRSVYFSDKFGFILDDQIENYIRKNYKAEHDRSMAEYLETIKKQKDLFPRLKKRITEIINPPSLP